MLTGNANAEFGNGNGAVVNMTTKSGTNQFHGNVFEFLRERQAERQHASSTIAAARKSRRSGRTSSAERWADRSERTGCSSSSTTRAPGSPTTVRRLRRSCPASMRAGDLSTYAQVIRDPTTGNPFPGNHHSGQPIRPGGHRPVRQSEVVSAARTPLAPGRSESSATTSVSWRRPRRTIRRTPRSITGSPIRTASSGASPSTATYSSPAHEPLPITIAQATNAPTTGGVINWTHTLSPTTVNEARIGFTRVKIVTQTIDPDGVLGTERRPAARHPRQPADRRSQQYHRWAAISRTSARRPAIGTRSTTISTTRTT